MTDLTIHQPAGAASGRIRIAFVGCALCRHHYGSLLRIMPEIQVAGVVDGDSTLARAWARELGGRTPAFETVAAMLTAARPDAVVVASPMRLRPADIAACLAAGVPTLADVPMTGRLAGLDALAAAAATGLLVPALPRHVDPYFLAVSRLIESSAWEAVHQLRCDWSFPVGGALSLESGVDPEDGATALLLHIAVQTADVCRWWMGAAQSVSADIQMPQPGLPGRSAGGRAPRDPIIANLIVAHERGQATHHLTQSSAQVPQERYAITGAPGRLELTVSAGERASASGAPALRFGPAGVRGELMEVQGAGDGLPPVASRTRALLNHFIACARGEASPAVAVADARAAHEMVHAAFLSAQEGSKVTLPLRRPTSEASKRIPG